MSQDEIEAEIQKINSFFCYSDLADVQCSEEMIQACPVGAITACGIDKKKCLAYCETQNQKIPDPGLCGMCFRFK